MSYYHIILLLSLVIILFLLPNQLYDYLQYKYSKIQQKVKKTIGLDLIKNAEELISCCSSVHSLKKSDLKDVKYKFFTDLLLNILLLHRSLGTPLKKYMLEIRTAMQRDIRCEKKIYYEKQKTLLQSVFLMILMFCFIYVYKSELNIQISNKVTFIILFSQLAGVYVVNIIYNKIKYIYFNDYSIFFEVLYKLKVKMEVGGSIQSILLNSNLNLAYQLKSKTLSSQIIRLHKLIESWRHTGESISVEIEELITEVNHLFNDSLDKFLESIVFVRFLSLLLFFLLPFLGLNFFFFSLLFS